MNLITIKLAFSYYAEKEQISRVRKLFYLDNLSKQIIECSNYLIIIVLNLIFSFGYKKVRRTEISRVKERRKGLKKNTLKLSKVGTNYLVNVDDSEPNI